MRLQGGVRKISKANPMYFGLNPMLIFAQKVGLRKISKTNPMYFGLNPMLIFAQKVGLRKILDPPPKIAELFFYHTFPMCPILVTRIFLCAIWKYHMNTHKPMVVFQNQHEGLER